MVTAERLRELLEYDPDTGLFKWLHDSIMRSQGGGIGHRSGDIAGTITGKGYLVIRIDGVLYLAHRLAFLWMTGAFPKNQVDHIDLVKKNNKFRNLREATISNNQWNRTLYRNNKTGLKGVCYDKQRRKWKAQGCKGRERYMSRHGCPTAAHFAYIRWARKNFGEFARAK